MRTAACAALWLWLAVPVATGAVAAPQNPVEKAVTKVQQTAKTVKTRVRRANRNATRQVKNLGKQTEIYTEAALTNLPTPEWNKLRAAYDYPAGDPKVQEFPKGHPKALMLKIKFQGVNGKPAEGVFLRPKAEGTYPCALLLHGLTNNKEIALKMFGDLLLDRGIAVLALDAPGHGTKVRKPVKAYWKESVVATAVREGGRNYRRALDWLTNRPDIDSSRIGLVGYSMGSITGSILGAVDDRIGAFSLCVGGDPMRVLARAAPVARRNALIHASPSLYVMHVTPRPVLFLNGKKDAVIVAPAAMLLHNAAKDPKQVVWYDGGHDLPPAVRKQAVDWLADKLDGGAQPGEPAPKSEGDAASPPPTSPGGQK